MHTHHKVHRHITAFGSLILFVGCFVLVGVTGGFDPKPEKVVHAAGCTIDAKLVNSCRPWVGATVGGYTGVASDAISQYNFANKRLNDPSVLTNPGKSVAINEHLDIIHTYHQPTQTSFNSTENNFMSQAGTYLLINWKPDFTWSNASGGNATVNSRIDAWADTFKSKPSNKFFFTIHHEPEDDVSSAPGCSGLTGTAGSSADYVNMWHNVRSRFDAKGVNNVVWVMNYMGFSGWNCMVEDLWPGNNYVDWVMYDPYAEGTTGSNSSKFTTAISNFYNYMTSNSNATQNYLSKTWGLAEHGVRLKNNTSQQAAIDYWNQGAAAITNNTFPKLKAYVVFDTTVNGTSQVGYDFNGAVNVDEQTAYNNFANTIFALDDEVLPPPPPPGDTQKPSVLITAPANGATVSGTITIGVDASDNVGITRVDTFWDGSNIIRGATSQNTYGWGSRWATTNASDGAHILKAVAYDAAGNSHSHEISITIQNNSTPPAPVINSFTASPSSVTVGAKSTLNWNVINVTTCSVTPGGPSNTTSTTWQTLALNNVGTTTYTLTCRNNANATTSKTVNINVTAAPTPPTGVTLAASNTSIQSGGSVKFDWASTGSTSCTLNPGNHFANGTTSSKTVMNITVTTAYKVTCVNNAGSTDSPSVTVNVSPTPPPPADPSIISFVANPATITAGQTSTLSWTASNIKTNGCSLAGSPLTTTGSTGQWTTGVLSASASYTLTCVNSANKSVSKSVSVVVDNQPAPPAPGGQAPVDTGTGDDSGTVIADSGDTVVNTDENPTVASGDLVTLDASNQTDDAKIENIEKIEYYLNEQLIQTATEPPFALDTSSIEEGEYNITQRTYFKDGSMSEQSQVITIVEGAESSGDFSEGFASDGASIGWYIGGGIIFLIALLGASYFFVLRPRGFKLPWQKNTITPVLPGLGDPDLRPLTTTTRGTPLTPGTVITPQEIKKQ